VQPEQATARPTVEAFVASLEGATDAQLDALEDFARARLARLLAKQAQDLADTREADANDDDFVEVVIGEAVVGIGSDGCHVSAGKTLDCTTIPTLRNLRAALNSPAIVAVLTPAALAVRVGRLVCDDDCDPARFGQEIGTDYVIGQGDQQLIMHMPDVLPRPGIGLDVVIGDEILALDRLPWAVPLLNALLADSRVAAELAHYLSEAA